LDNRNGFLQDLDRPMNNCVYFQRTGSSLFGYYVRDGKRHSCYAGWLEADIYGYILFPTMPGDYFIEKGESRSGAKEKMWHGVRLDYPYIKVIVSDPKQWIEDFRKFLHDNPSEETVVKTPASLTKLLDRLEKLLCRGIYHSAREINRAIVANVNGKGKNVYYSGPHTKNNARIYDARTRKGTLEVRLLETGVWVPVGEKDVISNE
jgi:hypothetical protein